MTQLFLDNSQAITDFKEANNLRYANNMLKFNANISTWTEKDTIHYDSEVLINISGYQPYEIRIIDLEIVDVNKFPSNFSDKFNNAYRTVDDKLFIDGSHPSIGNFEVEISLKS